LKIIIILLVIVLGIVTISCKDKIVKNEKQPIFTIGLGKGKVPKSVSMQPYKLDGNEITLKSSKIGDTDVLQSYAKLPLDTYVLKINDKEFTILIDNTNFTIDLSSSEIKGDSELQKKFSEYINGKQKTDKIFQYQKSFIENNLDNQISAIVLKDMLGKTTWRLEQTQLLFEKLNVAVKNSNLGLSIGSYITSNLAELKKNPDTNKALEQEDPAPTTVVDKVEVEVSQTPEPTKEIIKPKSTNVKTKGYAPYFYANNLDGVEVGLKQHLDKNKVVFIDFWASWCKPCRKMNPDYIRLYNKYKSKGFEIVSVSQDQKVANCQQAVTQDNMTWVNLIDNHAAIANMYKVSSIPDSFLVDNKGGIIARDIGPHGLERQLKLIFGF